MTNDRKIGTFTVTSTDYPTDAGAHIPSRFIHQGIGGENLSPALEWSGAPEETKSYAVTIYDPDAPTGSGWWHWLVFNIPASVTSLATGASDGGLPAGAVQSRTDYDEEGYGGPYPPEGHGDHRYVVTVYALDVEKLDLPVSIPPAQVGFNLYFHTLAKAELVARYGH